jgi:membrane protease YdiL (CAAX protease family)
MSVPPIDHSCGRRSRRFLLVLIALGLAGLATMLLAPIEQLLPAGIHVPRAALLVQPALIVVACCALGWWLAPKVGLDAPVLGGLAEGSDWAMPLRAAIGPALIGAVVAGVAIAGFEAVADDLLKGRAQSIDLPLVTRMLYGGTLEEIVFRWALLPAFALGLTKLRLSLVPALWTANVVTALLFAAGHVPGIMLAVTDPPGWLPGAVMLANTIAGLAFGWLFLRRGLEAAMIAHALAHLISVPLMALT